VVRCLLSGQIAACAEDGEQAQHKRPAAWNETNLQ